MTRYLGFMLFAVLALAGRAPRVVGSAGVAPTDTAVPTEPTGSAPGTRFGNADLYDVQPGANCSDYPIEHIHTAGIPVQMDIKWTMRQ